MILWSPIREARNQKLKNFRERFYLVFLLLGSKLPLWDSASKAALIEIARYEYPEKD